MAGLTRVLNRASTDNNCTLVCVRCSLPWACDVALVPSHCAPPSHSPDGKEIPCINLGSYNYLGFADDWQQSCKKEVVAALDNYPAAVCSTRLDSGGSTRAPVAIVAASARLTTRGWARACVWFVQATPPFTRSWSAPWPSS